MLLKGRVDGLGDNLLGFDVIGDMSLVVDATLEETGAREIS